MDAYEVLISAALIGDTAHFAREDEVEAAWAIVDPVLNAGAPVVDLHPGHLGAGRGGGLAPGSVRLAQPGSGRRLGAQLRARIVTGVTADGAASRR